MRFKVTAISEILITSALPIKTDEICAGILRSREEFK